MSNGGANTGGNAYTGAANALTTSGDWASKAAAMYGNTPTIAQGMGAYTNPFTQQVIDNSMNDLTRATAIQQEANKAAAANAGAFGGSRHGLVEAETNAASQRAMADLASNLRMQGFNTAANLSGQDISNRMTGAGGMLNAAGTMGNLGTAGFNMANTLQQQQWQQGLLQQQMRQQQLDDARNMFAGYTGAPSNYLNLMSSVLSGSPLASATSSTQGYKPGLLDIIGTAAKAYSIMP